jgi:hypothetical protein
MWLMKGVNELYGMGMHMNGRNSDCNVILTNVECVTIEGNKNEVGSSGVKNESTDRGM